MFIVKLYEEIIIAANKSFENVVKFKILGKDSTKSKL